VVLFISSNIIEGEHDLGQMKINVIIIPLLRCCLVLFGAYLVTHSVILYDENAVGRDRQGLSTVLHES
jgi:hypothetical protein